MQRRTERMGRVLTAFLLVLVLLVSGCGSQTASTTAATGAGAGTGNGSAPADKAAIKIGVIGAFQLAAGKEIEDAAKMAVAEINKSGGIMGRQIEAIYSDTKADPEQGKAAVEKLLFSDKVNFIIGEHRSEVALAVQPLIMQNKTVFINTGSASPLLSDNVTKDYNTNKYTFRTFMNSNQMGEQFLVQLKDMANTYKYDKIAVVAESAVWAEPIVKSVQATFGSKIVDLERPATTAKDFSMELSKVEKSGAQLIFTLFSADEGLIFTRQWNERQIPAMVTGYTVQAQSPDFWKQSEGKADGLITWKHGVRAPISDKSIPFWDNFEKLYGRVPGPYTGIATYDAFMVLADAITKAGGSGSDAVEKALEDNTFVGASGKVKFGKNHDPEIGTDFVPFTFVQWQNGKMVTVAPGKYKTGDIVSPAWIKK